MENINKNKKRLKDIYPPKSLLINIALIICNIDIEISKNM